jgi:hypothetical protein
MPRSTIDFDTVRKVGLALPGVEESTAYGAPALKVRGKLLACVPTHRSAEPGSLAVRVGFDDRAELLAAAPDDPLAAAMQRPFWVSAAQSRIPPDSSGCIGDQRTVRS